MDHQMLEIIKIQEDGMSKMPSAPPMHGARQDFDRVKKRLEEMERYFRLGEEPRQKARKKTP